MGQDKAQLSISGRRLLDHVLDAAREYTDRVVVVGGQMGVPESVKDRFPGEGPLGALITGLTYLGEGVHIALACDMPLVTAAALRMIGAGIGDGDAAVPEVGGRYHPLCSAYRGEAVGLLLRAFEDGERSLTRALGSLNVSRISEASLAVVDPELRFLTNLNTPAELARIVNG